MKLLDGQIFLVDHANVDDLLSILAPTDGDELRENEGRRVGNL
jgi:hypothetical protein